MRASYSHVIAVLGFWNAGKTCLLSSLYLMASHGILPAYRFAGSLTLQGLEDRARGARKWADGKLPDKLAEHTVLAEPRKPALVHLALEHMPTGIRHELLFTDLPGEWSTDLIGRASHADRFSFLKRADGVIVVVEAPPLVDAATRHNELHRTKLFLQRLATSVDMAKDTPLVILLSKVDLVTQPVSAFDDAVQFAGSLGFRDIKALRACAFSTHHDTLQSGTGLPDAIAAILESRSTPPKASADLPAPPATERSFTRYGG